MTPRRTPAATTHRKDPMAKPPKNSDFINTMVRTSKDANRQGWPGNFDPLKTVGDVFSGVMSGAGQVGSGIGSGIQGVGKSIGDFSSMAQGNLGAVQSSLQGLGDSIFGSKPSAPIPRYDPLSSVQAPTGRTSKPMGPKPKRRKSKKAGK